MTCKTAPDFELRPYQDESCAAIVGEFSNGRRSTLLVLPTGCGKTVVAAKLAHFAVQHVGKVLVLSHREELVRQTVDKFQRAARLRMAVEMADETTGGMIWMVDGVSASVPTLGRKGSKRLAEYAPDAFGLIIVDEAHHAVAAGYRRILDHFPQARVLGLTATPDRLDGQGMGQVFESVAYAYDIRQAIADGYLSPIVQRVVEIQSMELRSVKVRAGDFQAGELEAEMLKDETLHAVAKVTVQEAGDRPTLVFASGVAHAKALEGLLNHYSGREDAALTVTGETPRHKRDDAIRAFGAGRLQFMTNVGVFTEGFDAPPTACVVMARPTKSRALYAQCVGRGTRLHPGKADCLVLDFVGAADDHSLVGVVDVLDGAVDAPTKARVRKLQRERPDAPVDGLLALAVQQLAAESRLDVLVNYRTRKADPFALVGAPNRPGRWPQAPTDGQVRVLQANKIPHAGLDRGQASDLIDAIFHRRERGLCTINQARQLAKHGLNPDVDFETAREAMDAIAGNGWQAPSWLRADPRFAVQAVQS